MASISSATSTSHLTNGSMEDRGGSGKIDHGEYSRYYASRIVGDAMQDQIVREFTYPGPFCARTAARAQRARSTQAGGARPRTFLSARCSAACQSGTRMHVQSSGNPTTTTPLSSRQTETFYLMFETRKSLQTFAYMIKWDLPSDAATAALCNLL